MKLGDVRRFTRRQLRREKKEKDVLKMKKTIVICVTVVLCVAMMCGSFVYVGKGFNESIGKFIPSILTSTKNDGGKEEKEIVTTTEPETENTTEAQSQEATTEAATGESTTAKAEPAKTTAAEKNTTKKTTTTQKATTTKKATTTTKNVTTTTKKTTTAPAKLTTAQIIGNYNAAVNKAISSKAGYSKSRNTKLNSLDAGAFGKMSVVKDAVSNFLGVGDKTFSNAKGKSEFMSTAALKDADVKNASYTLSGGKYTYTLVLNNGSSSVDSDNKKNSSPVDRSGILVGTGDKSAYDHKCAENLYSAINNTDGASVKSVNESSSNVKCVAVVNASSGNLESLTVSFDFSVTLTDTKYVVTIKNAGGSASTTVKYSDFKF